jgi:monoamine oxidase
MFQPVGGMDQIAKAFQKRVGHLTRYHSEVEKVRQSPSGVEAFYVDTKTGARASVKGDYCLCAIPLSVLRGIDINFSPEVTAAMARVSYSTVGKIGLQMKRRFWELDDHIYGGHVFTNFEDIFQFSFPSGGWQSEKGVVLGAYVFQGTAAQMSAMSLAERLDAALAAGEKVFPGRYRSSFETGFSWFWHRAQYNLGGWAEWSDDARREAYPKLLEADGRLFMAGEHLSHLTGWQAGAFESAWQQIEKIHKLAQA